MKIDKTTFVVEFQRLGDTVCLRHGTMSWAAASHFRRALLEMAEERGWEDTDDISDRDLQQIAYDAIDAAHDDIGRYEYIDFSGTRYDQDAPR